MASVVDVDSKSRAINEVTYYIDYYHYYLYFSRNCEIKSFRLGWGNLLPYRLSQLNSDVEDVA